MPKTSDELATRALSILGVLQAGQAPSAEDLAVVKAVISPLVAQLGLEGITYVGDEDEIDDAVFLPLARRLALEVAPDFGLPAVDEMTIQAANRPLRLLAAARPTSEVIPAEYF